MSNGKMKPRNKKIIRKFLKTFSIALAIFLGGFFVVVVGLSFFSEDDPISSISSGFANMKSGSILDIFAAEEKRVNFLLIGVDDDGTRTDTMILGTFDPAVVTVDLISLPRDIKVTMPQDRYDILKAEGKQMNSDRTMKLTEVHHHAGSEKGIEYLQLQVEELLDLEIDFYVKVDLEAFRYIVDEIGGVEFDVPQRMYYYDPTQDLLIDLQPGVQLLNGHDAEGLVRFRSYPQADLMRVQVQQEFLKALISQALEKESIISNAQTMIIAALKYVETDFNMTSLPGYLKYLNSFSIDNLNTYTMPTVPDRSGSGKSYVLLDDEAAQILIEDIFFQSGPVESESSHTKLIQILNGGQEAGIASRGKEILEENGFTVDSIGNYDGSKEAGTRIFVTSRANGEDLLPYFKNSRIVYDPTISTVYDIVIVIGTDGID